MASTGDRQIEAWFPKLKPEDYEITSPTDPSYNCVAWAAGKTDAWWQAIQEPGYCWPDDLPWDDKIETIIRVFEQLGFEVCDGDALEIGFEKVALYGQDGVYEHAARQLANGKWTSKLGYYKDIEHVTLDGLTGKEYGSVLTILKRRVQSP